MSAAIAEFGLSLLPNMCEGARLKTDPGRPLTCVGAELLSGAAALNAGGGAREGVGCCCCDNSDPTPPPTTVAGPDDDPSAPEKTPVERHASPLQTHCIFRHFYSVCSMSLKESKQ